MNDLLIHMLEGLIATIRDVLPVVAVIVFFQWILFHKPLDNPRRVIPGLILVVVGLVLFVEGLSIGLFPLGETLARQFSQPDRLPWVGLFAFALAYSSALAEPALIAVAMKAEEITTGGVREWPLRNAVALGAGCGLSLGVYRIVHGGSLAWYVCLCYLGVLVLTLLAPREIIPLAYDSGGVTTSTVTVPLVTALGIGLASNLPGRNPVMDGFGLVAFTALFPIMTVMGYATLARYWSRLRPPGARAPRKEDL